MVAIAARIAIDWRCRHTCAGHRRTRPGACWAAPSAILLPSSSSRSPASGPTTAILILAIVNGLLTSIALRDVHSGPPDGSRNRLQDRARDVLRLDGCHGGHDERGGLEIDRRRRAHLVGGADHAGCRLRHPTPLQLLAAEGARESMPLRRSAILLVLAAAVGLAGYLYFGDRDEATGGPPPMADVNVPGTLSARGTGRGNRPMKRTARHAMAGTRPDRKGSPRRCPCHLRARPPRRRVVSAGGRPGRPAHHWRFGDMPRVEG